MPLIYITDKRFTGQFNENGVDLDSLSLYETYLVQLAVSAVITSYCHYYYMHADLLHRNVAILSIQYAVLITARDSGSSVLFVRGDCK